MLTYFAYFQSVVKYEIISCGPSNIKKVFLLQKRITTIMVGMGPRCSCRKWFRKLNILTAPCPHILSLIISAVNNHNYFQTNTTIHDIITRHGDHLHRPVVNHVTQKGVTCSSMRVFNILPSSILKLQLDKLPFKND
jgi:hypothetical protein